MLNVVRTVQILENDQLGQKRTVLSSPDVAYVNDDEEADVDEITDLIVLRSPKRTPIASFRVFRSRLNRLHVMSALYRPTWAEGMVGDHCCSSCFFKIMTGGNTKKNRDFELQAKTQE